jgi:2-dehydro-3-deoxyglucarate aldolase
LWKAKKRRNAVAHPLSARRDSRRVRFAPRQHVWHRAGLLRAVEQNITILVQIESQQGVDNVDAIAATRALTVFLSAQATWPPRWAIWAMPPTRKSAAIQHIFEREKAR